MHRRLALLALVAALAGCSRYTTRGQGPFNKPLPSPVAGTPSPGPQPTKTPLAINTPTPTTPPAESGESRLVPPKPPDGPTGFAVTPPQPARPPVVGEQPGGVVQAGGALPVAPGTQKPNTPSPAAINLAQLKKLAQVAADQWKKVDTYEARLVRKETVNGVEGQKEEVLYQFRREPMSVYMRNTGEVGKGREILYNPGKHGDKIHILTGAGDGFTGLRVTKSPDDPVVRDRSRLSIRDAGFGRGIATFSRMVEQIESGKLPPDALKYLGPAQRTEYPYPLEGVAQTIRAGDEKHSPGGSTRLWFFDGKPESPSYGLPVLVMATDPKGKELEYYCFERFRLPAGLVEADFDPARFNKKK
jgi:hypothetical protein